MSNRQGDTTMMMMNNEMIRRENSCNCGCRGRDHRRTFRAVVRDIQVIEDARPVFIAGTALTEIAIARGVVVASGTRYAVERRAWRDLPRDDWKVSPMWTITGLAD